MVLQRYKTDHNMLFSGVILLGLLTLGPLLAAPATAGTLQFYANGEELVTEGFLAPKLTKDGWRLTFSHAYVTLAEITAYQTSPPFDPHDHKDIIAAQRISLLGVHTVDLAAGTDDDPPVQVGEASPAPAGHYNAISWRMQPAASGPAKGYSMLLIGQASKGDRKAEFTIGTREEAVYQCGEFVGDQRKGFLTAGGSADLEMTFHFDHLFGRADKAADAPVNLAAPGFTPFAAAGKVHEISMDGLHLGHAGEGHCRQ
ncbi:hypothetical protein [Desulfurivibrio dismutans]|uniref:hypothetical protein n=1 Tax=Desulfurivibrio dismutans TaxID=1398908 RepID=UPI0023DA23E1|nr:hypothetical protein [Desulfurivibrio alkaliphilus]MDF1615099.1 DUF4382 domain-containing protein [Desulfurivibrio alkaliphilus]